MSFCSDASDENGERTYTQTGPGFENKIMALLSIPVIKSFLDKLATYRQTLSKITYIFRFFYNLFRKRN